MSDARLWVGIATFLCGALLWAWAQRRPTTPPTLRRLGLGVGALGLGTLASTQQGTGWNVSAISFSLIAIVLLATVLRDSLRR
jgi:predicted lysophospholipase L1 biosynthesis ABC-type transport system permease subunit